MPSLRAVFLAIAFTLGGGASSSPENRRVPLDFSFDTTAGLSNRVVTPNGDRKNDFVVFTFTNPRDSAASGKVYDLHGKKVADLAEGPVAGTTLLWDGKAGGKAVAAGIYVYVLSAEGKTYTGTLVVIR